MKSDNSNVEAMLVEAMLMDIDSDSSHYIYILTND